MYQPGGNQQQQPTQPTQSSNTFLYVLAVALVFIIIGMIYVTFFREDPLPASDSPEHQAEIDEIGWFAYSRAQHEVVLSYSNYDKDNKEMLDIDDIMKIANLFKDLWDYAVKESFKGENKKEKRRRREDFKDTLLELKRSCEPYGMTYNDYKTCVRSYVSKLNELGPSFDGDWKQTTGEWTYVNDSDGIGDINLDVTGSGCPESGYAANSDEVRYLGWLAYNRDQHKCRLRLNTSEDDQDVLDIDDIMKIANLFKDLWDYAVKESFKGKNKKKKRQRREEFKDTLVLLRRSCEPYGKTYNEFNTCVQTYVSKLNELGPSFDGDWKQVAGRWTYENNSDSIGDVNLDYLVLV